MTVDDAKTAGDYLDECARAVDRLHKMCCEPGRSPRMQAILTDIEAARASLGTTTDPGSVQTRVLQLEEIGAQIGHLRVACCTDARTPLYAEALSALTKTQIDISRSNTAE